MRKINYRFVVYFILMVFIFAYYVWYFFEDTQKTYYEEKCKSLECYSDYVIRNNVGNTKIILEDLNCYDRD